MPHDAAERACPVTGLPLPTDVRSSSREQRAEVRRSMSEHGPPERRPPPLPFEAQHVIERGATGRSSDVPEALPPKHDLQQLLGLTIGGRYRIKGVLGEGGMGTVYDAEHLGLGRQVAIKVLSPSQARKRVAVKRFQQEARAAGSIGHPNICEVYDLGLLDDGSPYLVMEKLVGQTLAERIAREGGLPFDEVVEVIVQVLSGLVAAHEKGIVHRDIKPENIFLARRLGSPPVIKLLDFGVSKMMPEFQTGEDALDLTRTGMVMGTPYYMSPEQARGERNLDGRVDVYACGVVMYEAIVGKRPFLAPNYNALLLAIINTNPRPLREARPKTPPELEAIIMRAMAKNRANRFPSAKHFLRELMPNAPLTEGSGKRLPPPPPTPEERKRAPVLGGGRPRPDASRDSAQDRETRAEARLLAETNGRGARRKQAAIAVAHELTDGPSATLRSRMADPAIGQRDKSRLDVRVTLEPTPSEAGRQRRAAGPPAPVPTTARERTADSIEIDIPIHVAIEEDGDEPTEIFRPGQHMPPPKLTRGRTNARIAPVHPEARPKRSNTRADDWDNDTVVTRTELEGPLSGAPTIIGQRPLPNRAPERRPFNPDETMKLDNTSDVEIVDERPHPRRRR